MNLNEKQMRYSAVYFTAAGIHLLYTFIFATEGCRALAVINAVILVTFFILGIQSRTTQYFVGILAVSAVCVAIHTITHLLLLGPIYGFQYMFLGVIPVLFCLSYVEKKSPRFNLIGSAGIVALFIILIIIVSVIPYPIYRLSNIATWVIVIMNILVAFAVAIMFMLMFTMQTSSDQNVLENQNTNLEQSASVDALTGLMNRRALDTYMTRAFERARSERQFFTIVMCDIDDFKKVNDTYGHECGDLVLQNIAHIFQSETRDADLVFRWGGEEILMLIEGNSFIAGKIAERCRKAIEESVVEWKDIPVKVTITMGGASYYQGATEEILIGRADNNLYKGKSNGKNQVVI